MPWEREIGAGGAVAAPGTGGLQVRVHVKRRGRPAAGSISEVLDSFRSEVRFYREIAPVAGERVPDCYGAHAAEGTVLVLEDLSSWQAGADAVAAARVLAGMHQRWTGQARLRWPWLRPVGAGAGLVDQLFSSVWPELAGRRDLTPAVRLLGERLVGKVARSERMISGAGPLTLVHGDASTRNMRTGPDGQVALLDWEDVSAAPGIVDLAWLLVSSVEPTRWDETLAAYGPAGALMQVLPAIAVQGLLSLSDSPAGSGEAAAWMRRLDAAAARL